MITEREIPVLRKLTELGIEYERFEHEPAMTMEICRRVGSGTGLRHCKNLFLTNKRGTEFYLVLLGDDKPFRTSSVSRQLGSSRLSFATEVQLESILGLTEGSVSITGLLNDKDHIVHAALDSDLLKEEKLLIHPNINTASLAVRTQDILKFIISLGYDYKLIEAEKESE